MKKEKLNQNREDSTAGNRAALNEMEENPAAEVQPGEQITEQELKAQRAARRKKRAEAKRKREKQIRMRKNIFKLLFLAAGLAIVFFAVGIHRRNVKEREAALAEAKRIEEEQAAYEATRKKAEEEQAALEASRKKAEEEQAALEASRKKAEEEQAALENAQNKDSKKAEEEAGKAEEDTEKEEAKKDYGFRDQKAASDVPEETQSEYAVLVNLDDGSIVAGRNYETPMNPASMTKILTLLVAAENIDQSKLDTDTYEISEEIKGYAWTNQMSQVGWEAGDTPTIRSLMYGTILPSGADAAMALAEYTAGSQEDFVELMNKKLEELGISDTAHFTNVVGEFGDEHYCSALDMATILWAAIDNELCREILSCHYYDLPPLEGEESGFGISNWFLRRIEDRDTHGTVVCGKTGYTSEAGNCAASYQESDGGGRYICVTADAPGVWTCIDDHVLLYETYTE